MYVYIYILYFRRREAVDSGDVQSEKCYIDLLGMIDKIGRLVNQVIFRCSYYYIYLLSKPQFHVDCFLN